MKKVKILGMSLIVASILGVGLTGCGGGNGGDTSGGNLAKPTLANALEVKKRSATNQGNLVPNSKSRGLNNINDDSRINVSLLAKNLSKRLLKQTKNVSLNSYSLNQAINEKENCANGGFVSMSGSADETNGANITFTFNQCSEDSEVINGSVNFSMSNYDQAIDDYKNMTIRFTSDFTVNEVQNQEVATIYANSYMTINITDSNKYTLLINMKATDGNAKYALDYCTFHFKENDSTTEMYQTQGKVYINELSAYVEYDTSYDMSKTPFVFNDYSENPISGEIKYIMADNAKMKIVVESRTEPITYIDVNGNGNFNDDVDLNEKKDSIEPDEKGNETTPPLTISNREISEKKYVVIVKNTKAGICESASQKEKIISAGAINPIFKEEFRNVTCATYDKTDDGSDYSECTIVQPENDRGNATCIIGFDDFLE